MGFSVTVSVLLSSFSHLKDGEQRVDDAVEVGGGRTVLEVEGAAEELHPEQGEDEDEEKEQEEERHDGG